LKNHRQEESIAVFQVLAARIFPFSYMKAAPLWRNVEVDPRISILSLKYPTCVNGVLHWIKLEGQQRSILCFCFESEWLKPFPSPPNVFENHNNEIHDIGHISMGQSYYA
jgi:hypothetical protein